MVEWDRKFCIGPAVFASFVIKSAKIPECHVANVKQQETKELVVVSYKSL